MWSNQENRVRKQVKNPCEARKIKASQILHKIISTHLLTVLTMRVILRTEQRKWIIKITRILINKVRSPLKGDMTYVKTKYFYRQFTG